MESLRSLSFPTTPLNFIKIIGDTHSATLKIPRRFAENHGRNMRNRVILKVPNGDIWQIDLKKSKGSIWLKEGWRKFADYYDLKYGHLLMFNYEGFSIFGVCIFDPSACEIVYPPKMDHLAPNLTEIVVKRSNSCEKVNSDELKNVKSEGETSSSWGQDQDTEIKNNGGKKKRALEAAKAGHKSDKPFFKVYMTPLHVSGKTPMHIPEKFIKGKWNGFKKHETCVLRLADTNKSWETTAHDSYLGNSGWLAFVKDNNVCAGDVCVFELVTKHRNILNVSIFRAPS